MGVQECKGSGIGAWGKDAFQGTGQIYVYEVNGNDGPVYVFDGFVEAGGVCRGRVSCSEGLQAVGTGGFGCYLAEGRGVQVFQREKMKAVPICEWKIVGVDSYFFLHYRRIPGW